MEDFEIKLEECVRLVSPLYSLCESDELLHETLDNDLRDDLDMEPTRTDPAVCVKVEDGQVVGLNGNYVDDLIRAWKTDLRKNCCETHLKL